jgi:Fe-S-cluster containining protein
MRRKRKVSLADVYARIPDVQCKGLCADSCGPIAMSCDEDRRLQELGVFIPSMVEGVEAIDRGEDYWCPALRDRRCTVYEDRPTICRLWGATTTMPCPHGCTPGNPMTQEESFELLALSRRAGGGVPARFFRSEKQNGADGNDSRRRRGWRRRDR